MFSSARRWIGTFRRASGKQEALRDMQDELAAAQDDAAEASARDTPEDSVIQGMKRKGYDDAQMQEFFAPPPPPPEPKKP